MAHSNNAITVYVKSKSDGSLWARFPPEDQDDVSIKCTETSSSHRVGQNCGMQHYRGQSSRKVDDRRNKTCYDAPNPESSRGKISKEGPPSRTRTMIGRPDTGKFRSLTRTGRFRKILFILSCIIFFLLMLYAVVVGVLNGIGTTKEFAPLKEKSEASNTYKDPNDLPKGTFVKEEQLQLAKNLFDPVFQILVDQAIQSKCGPVLEDGTYAKPGLTEQEVVEKITRRGLLSIWEAKERVGNLVVLMKLNPHWGISVSDGMLGQTNNFVLQLTSPRLPLSCGVRNESTYGVVSYLCFATAVYTIWQGSSWWFKQQERKCQEVYHYVERIIEGLANYQRVRRPGDYPYLAINHVRDQLIAPHDRQSLKGVWEAAVKFIEEKDSRVRVEIQPVNGEDYKVWRWVSPDRN